MVNNAKMTAEVEQHVLQRYELKKRIGKGAYGIVWKAVSKKTNEVVALKKIFDAFRNKTDAQRTFREIAFLRKFGAHPNIIKLHSIFKAFNEKDIYLVFEFMETDLHNVIKRGNILRSIHKQYITYQLLKALLYLHSANVIHRDLKPSNVLLDSDCFVKLCDFGLARSLAGRDLTGQSNAAISGNDEAVGDMPALTEYVATRWYRSPEILLACNNYTKGVDLWSMGCILGEMLAGKPLFPGASTLNQVERIMAGLPKPTKEDIESVKSSYSSSVLAKACVKQRKPVAEMMKNSDPNGIELMNLFLQFNPHKRITVEEALEHVYVKRFHNPIEEIRVSRPVLPPVSDNVQLSVAEYRNRLYQLIGEKKAPEKSRRPKRQSRTPSFDNSLPRTDSFKRQTTVLSSVSTDVAKPAAAKQPVRLDGRNLPVTPSSPPNERKSSRLLSSQPIEVCMSRTPIQNAASYPHVEQNREKSPHYKNTQPQHNNSEKHLPSATSDYFSGQSRDVSAMWTEKEAIQKDENSSKTPSFSTNFVQISGSDEQKRNSTISKVEGDIGQEKISSYAFRQDASEYPSWTNSELIAISNSGPRPREELVNAHPNMPTAKSVRSQSISRCQSVVCSNGTSTVSTPTRKLSPNLATTISETLETKSTNLSRMGSGLSSKESVAAAHRLASKKQSTPVQLPDSVSANSYLSVYANRTCPTLSAKQRFLVPTFAHQRSVNGDVQIDRTSEVPNGKPVSSKRFPEQESSHGVGGYTTVYLDNTELETVLPVRKRSVLFTQQVNGYQNPERWDKDTHPTNLDSENDFTKLASNANRSPLLNNFPTGSTASSAIPKLADEEAPYAFVSSVHRKREVAAYAPYLRAASNSQFYQKPLNVAIDAERHTNSMYNLQTRDGVIHDSLHRTEKVSQHTPLRVPQSRNDMGCRHQVNRGSRSPQFRCAAGPGDTGPVTAKSTHAARSNFQPGRFIMNQNGFYPSLKPANFSYYMPLASHKRTLNRRILDCRGTLPQRPAVPSHIAAKR